MDDPKTLVPFIGYILAGTGTLMGALVLWGIQRLISAVFDSVVEMKLLRAEMTEVKSYGPRIVKLEKDINEAHGKIRGLQNLEE